VVPAGVGIGLGRGTFREWLAPFASFKLGSEEVRHTKLRFASFNLPDADMVLGMDFFLSHRIYVANSQHKLYFTYNGGPIFNLSIQEPVAAPSASVSALPTAQASTATPSATELAAQGSALVARQQYDQAIAILTQAAELDPKDPRVLYERSMAYLARKQADPALSDLNQALQLKPDYVDALLTRARVQLSRKDTAAARADLDALDRIELKGSDLRYRLSDMYLALGAPDRAVHQLDLWISVHSTDARLASAQNSRCWERMLMDQELAKAEADCHAAVRATHNDPGILDSLAWVHFRQGKFDQSMREFNGVLKRAPKTSSSLYGRGMDELKLGQTQAGEADIAAAKAMGGAALNQFDQNGLRP
jgi:tetratricopeptide (TPR) repeat protein